MRSLTIIFTLFGLLSIVYFLNQSNNIQPINNTSLESTPSHAYERQQFHLDKRLPLGQDYLPMDVYSDAQEHIKTLGNFSTKAGKMLSDKAEHNKQATSWEALGPGNIGGRTRTLVFNPDNLDTMYAAGVSGGIWKTTNAGEYWQPIADYMANINIGALAIDTIEPKTLYAGTGELYRKTLRPYSSMSGAGIFKTIDGGETWLQLQTTVNDNFLYVSDIVISPNNHKRIYAATNTGVWRSDDGGISFVHSLFPNDGLGNELYEGCNDLSIREDLEDDWLLVSCASRSTDDRYFLPGLLPEACNGPCDARIFINTHAQDSDDWLVALTEPGMGRTQMSIHKANQNIIYASSANTDGGVDLSGDGFADLHNGLHAIFRSNDGGLTWEATLRNTDSNKLNTQLFSYAEGALGCNGSIWYYSAGWYNQAIVVNPIDPDVVWVAGMEIYRSDDGGHNFGMASHWDAIYYNDINVEGAYVHADQHSMVFHPAYDGINNKTLYSTNDGGIYLTDDDSQPVMYGNSAPCYPPSNGVKWDNINNNYAISQFYTGDVFNTGDTYIAGAQDNGTVYGSDSLGLNGWYSINGGDGSELAINKLDQNNYYVSSQNANIHRTNDNGQTWKSIRNGLTGRYIFITPFKLDPNNTNNIFLGGNSLWYSPNRGDSWISTSPNLGYQYSKITSALAIAPNNSSHVIYANREKIFTNRNSMNEIPVVNIKESSPRYGWVSSIEFEPNNENIAYATYSTFGGVHVWKTIDGGNSWLPIDGQGQGQLPDVPVHSIVIDPNNNQRLFIGTDLGVFVSVDGGNNWAVENTGFSQVITERLVINTPDDGSTPYLFAFTYGRGVWRVPLNELDAQPDFSINDNISGLWYNPSQSGHGLQVEVFKQNGENKLFVSWYAYLNENPIWISGIGTIQNNKSIIDVIITDNTGFPPGDFTASDVERIPWGSIILDFSGENNGQLSWSSILPEYNNGSLSIQKLTSISEDHTNSGINACHSGSWYNSTQSGHGYMVEVIDSIEGLMMVLTWFTYFEGQQYWILATGLVNGETATLMAKSGYGSSFPPNFESSDIIFENWGEITFTKIDDNNAQINWQSKITGFDSNTIAVSRLTQLSGHECL